MTIKAKPLLVHLLIPLAVGGLSALLTGGSMAIYESIRRPPLSPPGPVFPIVWTALYLLMGVSAYLVWMERRAPCRRTALGRYAAQLAVNFAWPLLFFRARAFLPALVWLLLLIALIAAMLSAFKRVRPLAAWLQIPYLLWCCFAAYLNAGVWLLNR